ncbi:MAG: hypothetical protein ACOZIN_22430 [Myxococcota bacterium]
MTPDPVVGNPLSGQSFNAYSYVYNSPLRYVDPSGEEPITIIALIFVGAPAAVRA